MLLGLVTAGIILLIILNQHRHYQDVAKKVLLVPPATPVVQLVFANAIDVAVLVAVVDQVVAKFGREFIK